MIEDKIIQEGLLDAREKQDYVCKFHNKYFSIEKLIKLMIKKNRCAEFVDIISQMECYRHVIEHIGNARQKAETGNQRGARGNFVYKKKIVSVHLWSSKWNGEVINKRKYT